MRLPGSNEVAGNPFAEITPTSLYVHIPFCVSKCVYCDFCSLAGGEQMMQPYMDALERELDELSELREERGWTAPLRTVYIGGGTPSALPGPLLERLFAGIRERFGYEADAEVTMETNPALTGQIDFAALAAAGLNRLSIGLQAAQDRLLERLGRPHDVAAFVRTVEAARAAGINQLSVDLMIGLPGQTVADVNESMAFVIAMGVDHLSFYSLIIEDNTPLGRQYAQGQLQDLPDEDAEREQYRRCIWLAKDAGFQHYEISNAGRAGAWSRHNQVYWRAEPYYAAGLSASGYMGGLRWTRTRDLDQYLARFSGSGVAPNDQSLTELEVIDGEEARSEWFLLGFRLLDGLAASAYESVFSEPVPADKLEILAGLAEAGLVQEKDAVWSLTEKGLDMENVVSAAFLSS